GIVVGYLLQRGEEGLTKIADGKLTSTKEQEGDVYPCLQALRYLWSYGNGKISQASLKQAMRKLIDKPDFAESALTDLARWKDWDLQPRLMELYGAKDFNDRATKTPIIYFLIACTKDIPADGAENPPAHVIEARANLTKLRERDPKLVADAEKYFFLR